MGPSRPLLVNVLRWMEPTYPVRFYQKTFLTIDPMTLPLQVQVHATDEAHLLGAKLAKFLV
jgi:hypothetical protein